MKKIKTFETFSYNESNFDEEFIGYHISEYDFNNFNSSEHIGNDDIVTILDKKIFKPEFKELKTFETFDYNIEYISLELQKRHNYDDNRLKDEIEYIVEILSEIDKENITKIYRVLFVPNKKYINEDDLGDHWTLDLSSITNYELSLKDNAIEQFVMDYDGDEDFEKDDFKQFLITAETISTNINKEITLENYLEFPYEVEVELYDFNKINILSINEKIKNI